MATPLSLVHIVGENPAAFRSRVLPLVRYLCVCGHRVAVAGALTRVDMEEIENAGARWINMQTALTGRRREDTHLLRRLRQVVEGAKADLIHTHGLSASLATSRSLGRLRPAPAFIATIDDLHGRIFSLGEKLTLRRLLAAADHSVVTSGADAVFISRYHRRAAVHVIHDPLELRSARADFDAGMKRKALGLGLDRAVVGVFSPLLPHVGLANFIKAAALVAQRIPDVDFLFVGDGTYHEEIIRSAHALGISGSTVIRGDRVDKPEIIAALNVLVIPHEIPGAVQYALQALMHEVPLVAVTFPGLEAAIGELLPDALVESNTPEVLATAIEKQLEILPSPEKYEPTELGGGLRIRYDELFVTGETWNLDQSGERAFSPGKESSVRRAARLVARKFDVQAMRRQTFDLYEETLGRPIVSEELTRI